MEENPTLESEAWGSSREWLAPREARGAPCSSPGPSLSSVLNELPSAATLRYRDPGVLPWGALEEEEEDGGRSRKAFTEVTQTELQDPHPSRELPWPMQARRAHRQRNASRDQVVYGSGTKTDRWARLLRRSKEKTKEGLRSLQPWAWTLKRIGGQFGAGTESYFSLLRFLLLLNVLASVLMACMTLLPTWLGGAPPGPPGPDISSPCGSYNPHSQGLVTFATQLFNLLSGEGYLEWSPLFYGFYPPRPRLAVTYLCWAFAVGLICLLLILHRSVSGLKQTLLAESEALTSYSHRVFSAWDFGLCGDVHVRLRQRIILYELKVELEETVVRRQAAVRTLGQQARVWLVRVLLNLLVVALLGAAFYGVYWATGCTVELQEMPLVQELPLLKLGVNYLPSIFIAGVNFVLPPVFKLIAPLEGYTRSRQIVFILLRTVFLRLASLVVLLFSLWNQITCGGDSEAEDCKTCGYNYKQLPCWETVLGQEMYKLLLFDLLTVLAVALLIQFPRKLLCGLCPGALGRLAGTQEFQVPDEVLGLIYAQTVVWVGSFFCPLLPLLNTVKFLLLFYLKKLTLFSTCSPAARTFRASAANFFFPLVLLLGLAISSVPLLYSIFLIPPSKLCGPFRGQSSIWAQIPESISSLPETTQNFLFFLGTQAFAVPLLLISSILMAYTVALANSYGRLISELKRQRETEAQNKVFLARRAVALTSTKPAL
ncbi:voltage-gated chloride channel TMC4 isoform 1 [Homo sapiens]|uniref:Transmembrane channel-like protein n=1 Tax=Homo sapiens TaxID=9606 RepID=A0A087WT65_HUMAN|nr:transmembrane channel-like protein 4 isoform 1 [Homo sapiens]KAI2593042.1 transmembrane channel like 4 [Homo sapiens]|eukprot:NP_001138775.2 transmembrane channel-like protein 4 isoform 1 [Homo sapiens]